LVFRWISGCCAWSIVLYDPAEAHFFPQCPLHALTGLYCPGCGTTRVFHHLLHGDPAGAFAMNPLMLQEQR